MMKRYEKPIMNAITTIRDGKKTEAIDLAILGIFDKTDLCTFDQLSFDSSSTRVAGKCKTT